jgi:hypothetical protein
MSNHFIYIYIIQYPRIIILRKVGRGAPYNAGSKEGSKAGRIAH